MCDVVDAKHVDAASDSDGSARQAESDDQNVFFAVCVNGNVIHRVDDGVVLNLSDGGVVQDRDTDGGRNSDDSSGQGSGDRHVIKIVR